MKVRKAVIPAAGMGTRFLPVTKAVPKELLPLVDRAAMQYVVEEAAAAGIEEVIVVTARGKEALADYFDKHAELESLLAARGDNDRLAQVRRTSELVQMEYVRQPEQLGLGHAVACAARVVGSEPFAVILPDDIIAAEPGALTQLLEVFERYGSSVIAVEEVDGPAIQSYGVIDPEPVSDGVYRVRGTVEKPALADAPSNLGIVGRYVLTPQIFDALAEVKEGAIGELQLTDGLAILLKDQDIYALRFQGTRYDVGNPMGLLRASVEMALRREDTGPAFEEFLRRLLA
ncbi:MAG: UTP--glucose-1-phosphate uridylyltransferase GalU [Chloroflexota bacterium]|nr:UTP--glucose-1-phosphate uridylyltransferase GalU [Chloroflexota bacterium]MDE2941096.1 UTP--glucose-1-phosphate uridylyltransferase GalU [Chloroflexota bacterium]MDE3267378.1 UTP--glucose-1-phosphate uridylyltransferase GalU [Chloroflexota bacterium]